MTKQTEAMKLALEALEHCKDAIVERGLNGSPEFAKKWGLTLPIERSKEAITALRQSIADEALDKKAENARELGLDYEPAQQEPVTDEENEKFSRDVSNFKGADPEATKYALEEFLKNRTSPPAQRKPLTLGQKQRLWSSVGDKPTLKDRVNAYGLAIEAAHGIKENT